MSSPTHTNAKGANSPKADERSSLLESSQNVVTAEGPHTERAFVLSRCGCDSWFCTDCCERKGYKLREELTGVLETFTALMMVTLTIDPALFASPREAYFYIRKHRGISRLVRELKRRKHLHSKRYFAVLEFQKDTEQAHYHVLIDASYVPKAAIDAAWSKLRPHSASATDPNRPAFGMTRFSKRTFEGGALHAARYATKYLVKIPEQGWPNWVLKLGCESRVHRYSTSHSFWNRERKVSTPTGKTRKAKPRSYAERIEECGTSSNLFELTPTANVTTGEIVERLIWRRRLDVGADLISMMAERGHLGNHRHVNLSMPNVSDCIAALSHIAGRRVSSDSNRAEGQNR